MTNKTTVELLKNHFDIALETLDGVKKLRELILSLAMQGKLVKQDKKDQPAGELLKEIEGEKKRLIKDGEIKKLELLPQIKFEKIPFVIPMSWVWVRLGTVVTLLGDGIHGTPAYDDSGEYFFINGNNLADGKIEIKENTKAISLEEYQKHKKKLTSRTVFVSINGTIGNVAFYNNEKVILGKSACYFNLFDKIDKFFIKKLINSKYFLNYAFSSATGSTIKNVSLKAMREFLFPLPPLAEQKRIVAKIDQLMSLCDKLEAQRNERSDKRLKIHSAAINGLLSAPDKSTFNSSWNFITKNFNELYSVQDNVEELKKAILQLAVMGKLVKQDPKDQPASVLLKEIEAEKKRLVKEGKIRKQEPLPEIKPEEIPYEVPIGWLWARLGMVGITQTGTTPPKKDPSNEGNYIPFIGPGDISSFEINYRNNGLSENGLTNGRLIEKHSILMVCIGGSIGKTAINEINIACNQQINTLTPFIKSSYRAIFYAVISPFFQQLILDFAGGSATPIINKQKWCSIPIPLPPLAEQKRIVAKIDQLVSLCNSLEQDLKNSSDKQTAILNAVLAKICTN